MLRTLFSDYRQVFYYYFNNCLANIRDLHSFARNVFKLLEDDGILSIETGYLPLQATNRAIEMINHEHYHYFSLRSIIQLFASSE